MVWTAKNGHAHLFEKVEEGQKSVCKRVVLDKLTRWEGISPKSPPCLLCAQALAQKQIATDSSEAVVPEELR
jgi:hypothetical protein